MERYRMTDNEIIKALECCCTFNGVGCQNCPQYDIHSAMCVKNLIRNALDLINRQYAEVDRLEKELELANADKVIAETHEKSAKEMFVDVTQQIKTAKSKAIKEFAERLKNFKIKPDYPWYDYFVTESAINNLVKEMTEVNENDRA